MSYAIIVENDESRWDDRTGVAYHFPKRYVPLLKPGTHVIYYKGTMRRAKYRSERLSDDPHYFGTAVISAVYDDPESDKGDKFAEVKNFRPFSEAVPNKRGDDYFEDIPPNRETNYWRDGVRSISPDTYEQIVAHAGDAHEPVSPSPADDTDPYEFESREEGGFTKRYVKTYERDPELRRQAIVLHGLNCKVCGFNFKEVYGEWGRGFIHVHHVKPVSEYDDRQKVNPQTDLIPLCPNCHAMVHRRQNETLSIVQLKEMMQLNSSLSD